MELYNALQNLQLQEHGPLVIAICTTLIVATLVVVVYTLFQDSIQYFNKLKNMEDKFHE